MKVIIKTEAMQFELDDPNVKIANYFGSPENQKVIDYLKQLIESVSIESQKISNPPLQEGGEG